ITESANHQRLDAGAVSAGRRQHRTGWMGPVRGRQRTHGGVTVGVRVDPGGEEVAPQIADRGSFEARVDVVPAPSAPLGWRGVVADVEASEESNLLVDDQHLAVIADGPPPASAPGPDRVESGEMHAGVEKRSPVSR